MSQQSNSVTLEILEREYQFSSPQEQAPQLKEAARFLDQRMREIRDSGRVVGTERIAVMAAINLAFELLHGKNIHQEDSINSKRIHQITHRIEEMLASDSQLELT